MNGLCTIETISGVPTWGGGGGESPRAALPKGAAFGRMREEKREETTKKGKQA